MSISPAQTALLERLFKKGLDVVTKPLEIPSGKINKFWNFVEARNSLRVSNFPTRYSEWEIRMSERLSTSKSQKKALRLRNSHERWTIPC